MRNYIFLPVVVLLFSCDQKNNIKKEYYSNGVLKSEIEYQGEMKNGKAIFYHMNGKIEKKQFYIDGILDGDFFSYDTTGAIVSKGYFKDGIAIGPTYYYYKSNIVLYNERDFYGKIYYVKKYDSTSQKLIKEEGVCISPNSIIRKIQNSNKYQYLFAFAQPDGTINMLNVTIDNKPIKFDTIKGHVGRIELISPDNIGNKLKILSLLKSEVYETICTDSLVEIIPGN